MTADPGTGLLATHTLEPGDTDFDFDEVRPKFRRHPISFEFTCREDERQKVVDTSGLPFKAICKLLTISAGGRHLVGTGWLTHSNKLYTAGHNVFDHDEGGWMQSVVVVPGMAGENEPIGRYTAAELLADRRWTDRRSKRFDMGAIKLSAHVPHDAFLVPTLGDGDEATVCGYASDRDMGRFQYRMRESIRKEDGQYRYMIDTYGGQGGAPLLLGSNKSIGIHNYGGCENSASDLFEEFVVGVDAW